MSFESAIMAFALKFGGLSRLCACSLQARTLIHTARTALPPTFARKVLPSTTRLFTTTTPLLRNKAKKKKPKAPKTDFSPVHHDQPDTDILPHKTETYKKVYDLLYLLNPPDTESVYYSEPEFWLTGTKLPVITLQNKFSEFAKTLLKTLRHGDFSASGSTLPSITQLQKIFSTLDDSQGEEIIKSYFLAFLGESRSDDETVSQQTLDREKEKSADMRFPHEWYPAARQMHREWHLHVGPTNSGKTYRALKRLEESKNGMYAGPLRLLAHEIFERMNAKGIPCNLVTGDDQRTVDEAALVTSSTVEMADLTREMEVAVLDEIQMIGDEDRGWAWTQALLGLRAKEIHLCGEERTVDIIKKQAELVGDVLHINRYERLGPLEVMESSLKGTFEKLEKGDCVVTFSRKQIFALKKTIEERTGKRCAVIYGGLPPETRSEQAKLFNDPDSEYQILVASDAVGMGLNLSIKRVIFETMEKFNGVMTEIIPVPQIKQIAGRAGRFRIAVTRHNIDAPEQQTPPAATAVAKAPQPGWATTLHKYDHRILEKAMKARVPPIRTAGLLPTQRQIEEFESLFPRGTKFSKVLKELNAYMRTTGIFHSCVLSEQIKIAALLDDIKGLTVGDRIQFCNAPIPKEPSVQTACVSMAKVLASGDRNGSIVKIPSIDLEALDEPPPRTMSQLRRLEALSKVINLYLWLSYRFPTTFSPISTALEIKKECESLIDLGLRTIRFAYKEKFKRLNESIEDLPQADADLSTDDLEIVEEATESAVRRRLSEMLDEEEEESKETYEDIPGYASASRPCFYCGESGHKKADCPRLTKKNKRFRRGGKGHMPANRPRTTKEHPKSRIKGSNPQNVDKRMKIGEDRNAGLLSRRGDKSAAL